MWHCGLAAWARATYHHHVNGTDTVGRSVGRSVDRSVGRSVDARGPVDHDSVGLAQARPNYMTEIHVCSKLYQCISSTFMRAVSIIVGHAGGGILCTLEHRCFAHMLGGL